MAESLEEFIKRRKEELTGEASQLKRRLSDIDSELKNLELAERTLRVPVEYEKAKVRKADSKNCVPFNTIKSDVISVLRDYGLPMMALDILAHLNRDRSAPLERTSLSPQLSRLKADGLLKLDGSAWSLTEKGIEEAKYHQK